MLIDNSLLIQVANNARIKLTEQEQKELLPQLKDILNFFEKLNQASVDDIKPSFHPIKIKNNFREDIPKKSLTQEQALENVKKEKDGFVKGPKIVE